MKMKGKDHDWRVHQARLHMHGNHKFQSVYTQRHEPILQRMNDSHRLGDMVILGMAVAVLAIFVMLLAIKYQPAFIEWLML